MSLFPDEDILTRKIETWRGFIDKLPSNEDKLVFKKLLNDCYKYSTAMNNHAQIHPFPPVFNYGSIIDIAPTYQPFKINDTIQANR